MQRELARRDRGQRAQDLDVAGTPAPRRTIGHAQRAHDPAGRVEHRASSPSTRVPARRQAPHAGVGNQIGVVDEQFPAQAEDPATEGALREVARSHAAAGTGAHDTGSAVGREWLVEDREKRQGDAEDGRGRPGQLLERLTGLGIRRTGLAQGRRPRRSDPTRRHRRERTARTVQGRGRSQ